MTKEKIWIVQEKSLYSGNSWILDVFNTHGKAYDYIVGLMNGKTEPEESDGYCVYPKNEKSYPYAYEIYLRWLDKDYIGDTNG